MNDRKVPDTFNGWEIETIETGRGASGNVYRMTRTDGGILDESALKIIHVNSEDYLKLVLNEIKALQKLRGESTIVSVMEFVSQKAEPGWDIFIRMEYLACFIRS